MELSAKALAEEVGLHECTVVRWLSQEPELREFVLYDGCLGDPWGFHPRAVPVLRRIKARRARQARRIPGLLSTAELAHKASIHHTTLRMWLSQEPELDALSVRKGTYRFFPREAVDVLRSIVARRRQQKFAPPPGYLSSAATARQLGMRPGALSLYLKKHPKLQKLVVRKRGMTLFSQEAIRLLQRIRLERQRRQHRPGCIPIADAADELGISPKLLRQRLINRGISSAGGITPENLAMLQSAIRQPGYLSLKEAAAKLGSTVSLVRHRHEKLGGSAREGVSPEQLRQLRKQARTRAAKGKRS